MIRPDPPIILIRGAGDLASGVAHRLFRSGFGIVMTEIASPLSVRRLASFSEAVFEGQTVVEGVRAQQCGAVDDVPPVIRSGSIAVLVDPAANCRNALPFLAAVEGRMLKAEITDPVHPALFTIGLGPGFTAGVNCGAAVETNRGADMGRVLWQGSTQEDTSEPEMVLGIRSERVLRAPASGTLTTFTQIGCLVEKGSPLAEIGGIPILAPFTAVVRGLLRNGTHVQRGMKIGDLDPRCDPALCFKVSDKSLATGGGVLEALLSNAKIRQALGKSA
jgi:selenium-dependent molybdenum hydroxylase system protein, YqeB family